MIKQRTILKKLFVAHCVFALMFCSTQPTSASVIDAPHNETHAVKCGDCHAYSVWWQYSPAANNSDSVYTQITNGVCNKCHAPGGPAPNKIGHNWESMGDIHDSYLGMWETKCLDCHNPHYQDQLTWLSTESGLSSDLYLATGTISAGSLQVNSANNTTTLAYKNAAAHLNWINPSQWAEKSTPGRGLILLLMDSQQNTFEINSASETTAIIPGTANGAGNITLQGSVPTSYNGADTNFALIYGQLVKKTITTPNSGNKDVKFFDPLITYADGKSGGTADSSSNSPQGICQVCHTNTKYYNSDGLQPDRNNPTGPRIPATPHNATAPCTGCHAIALGFQPTNADHTFISNTGTTCASCHNDADIVTGTHNGNCTACHLGTPPALITPFPSPKWPTLAGQSRESGTCYDCHGPIAAEFTAHPDALDHTGQVDPHPNCTGCHFHSNKDVVTIIHDLDRDHNGSPDGTPCSTCHNLTYNASTATYSGSGALIGRAAQKGPGNCTKCHTEIAANFFVHPKSNDHTNQVVATPQCAACHDGDPVNDVHSWSCGMCHVPPTGLLKGVALTKGPGDCVNCHTDFYVHSNEDALNHSVEVTATAACVTCHTDSNLITGLHGRNGCATCHDQFGALVGSAAGHDNGGDCATCHTAEAVALETQDHPAQDHTITTSYVIATSQGNCTSCHAGDPVDVVHNKNCLGCHLSLNPADIHTLIGSAAGRNGYPSNTCADCHGTIGSRFTTHKKTYTHENQVTAAGTNCFIGIGCHIGDPIWDTHEMNCATCHAKDGRLIGLAADKGTGKPPTASTASNCSTCHTSISYTAYPHVP